MHDVSYFLSYTEAVHRFYESRRNDSRPDRIDSAQKAKQDSKKKEMRKKVIIYLCKQYE